MSKVMYKDASQMYFISPCKKKKKKVEDVFGAYLVQGAEYTKIEGYPILERWMEPEIVDESIKIIPFNHYKQVDNLSDYYICFYCKDRDFNCVRSNPSKYISVFRKAKGIIGFDYSIYGDMQPVKQKSQMNDNLSLTFYYGMRYIKIIPNIRYGNADTRDDFLNAIPKNGIIAIGSYGCVKTKEEKRRYRIFLADILIALTPKIIIVYGAMPEEVFGPFVDIYKFIKVDPYIKGVFKNE